MNKLEQILIKHQSEFAKVVDISFRKEDIYELNLSIDNEELRVIENLNTENLTNYIDCKLKQSGASIAIGGYAEDRLIYRKSKHFGADENARTFHLGLDIWCSENSSVFAPIDSVVHSFKDNDLFGDYGPTIILEHKLDNMTFYTLYGHLTRESLNDINPGKLISKGEKFAEIGNDRENGNWPPHLHFQVITDMQGKKGDFPGVSSRKELDAYMEICPDPSLIINVTD